MVKFDDRVVPARASEPLDRVHQADFGEGVQSPVDGIERYIGETPMHRFEYLLGRGVIVRFHQRFVNGRPLGGDSQAVFTASTAKKFRVFRSACFCHAVII